MRMGLASLAMLLAFVNLALGLAVVDANMHLDRSLKRESELRKLIDKATAVSELWKHASGEYERANATNAATLDRCMATLRGRPL